MSLVNDPIFPELKKHLIKGRRRDGEHYWIRVNEKTITPQLLAQATSLLLPCPACGRPYPPIRDRITYGKKDTERRNPKHTWYVGAVCRDKGNKDDKSCAKGDAASSEIDKIAEQLPESVVRRRKATPLQQTQQALASYQQCFEYLVTACKNSVDPALRSLADHFRP